MNNRFQQHKSLPDWIKTEYTKVSPYIIYHVAVVVTHKNSQWGLILHLTLYISQRF